MKKNILLIGVGGTGSNAVETFYQKLTEFGNQTDNKVSAIVFDTDAGDLKKISCATTVVMADDASVGTICDRVGKQYLREWFPCEAKDVRAQEMMRGASQWRKKSYLAFLNLMNKPSERFKFIGALEDMVQDPGAICEVYVIASVAGGTGSGSFIPIALYAKRYLRKSLGKDPIVNAMIALPDIYADEQTPENRIKVYSNAYAILRELNAINLVARNYNSSLASKKKAPIRLKIGHEDEPNVGVLFDASDKRFWTPEAAPFSQVFLLDRIPGLHSISAHDMVLANSLYTIICTEIGAKFDSEFSNHELVRSQNNGSNAIYAGVSTSQIRFPKDSVLEYLAYKKTLSSCESEWLILHTSVENAIKEKEREAKAARRRFVMNDSEYAELVIKEMEQKQKEDCDALLEIVERGVERYDSEGRRIEENAGQAFIKIIDDYIMSRIPDATDIKKDAEKKCIIKKNAKPEPKEIVSLIRKTLPEFFMKYYLDCLEAVKCVPVSAADSVITLNKKKIGTIGDKYSLYKNLLSNKDGTAIHPVAALIRLSQFRIELAKKIKNKMTDWADINNRSVTKVPVSFMSHLAESNEKNSTKSAYISLGEDRYALIYNDPNVYLSGSAGGEGAPVRTTKKTKVAIDMAQLKADSQTILNKISGGTRALISYKVYTAIAKDVDILIAKYRSFFSRFEKEKETLEEQVADAHRKDEGAIDSIINVYSSKDDKDAISAIIDDGNGPVTEADLLATDDIVGSGVYNTVFKAAVAEASDDDSYNANDSGAYRSIFNCMVEAYRTSISRSEMFREISSYNAIEAIVASCGENPTSKEIDEALRGAFSVAQKLAIPPLRLDPNLSEMDLVTPSSIMVFMISYNTALYIKRHAEMFGLKIPADQTSEGKLLASCAEQFLHDYSGNTAARVSIVTTIPDQVLYCTGEIMDITPLCISKFNELDSAATSEEGEVNADKNKSEKEKMENADSYYRHYCEAIRRFRKYDTDMWNPHIGNDLYKRGYLPYMNPDMEEACDDEMVKALLYGLNKGLISYTKLAGHTSTKKNCFIYDQKKLRNRDNLPIDKQNISQLLDWLRNEDQLVDDWSHAFDKDIKEQLQALPSIVSDTELKKLEDRITKSAFTKLMNTVLFEDKDRAEGDSKKGPSAVELAYLVKSCEENDRDCDDAERILRVLYKVFLQMITFRIAPEQNPERYIQVYRQQLVNFYEALASIDAVTNEGDNCELYYGQLVEWINGQGLFIDCSGDSSFDKFGYCNDGKKFDFRNEQSVMTILKKYKKKKAEQSVEDDAETDTAEAPAEDAE